MQRNNTYRIIFIVLTVLWAGYQLYPTFMVSGLKDDAMSYRKKLTELTNIQHDELNEALSRGILEKKIRQALGSDQSSEQLTRALHEAEKIIEIDDKLATYQTRSIKRGLDLQGGSYLVYEVDLPKLVYDLAKNKDDRFEKLMSEIKTEALKPNVDFFKIIQERFTTADIRLSQYFGTRAQTDAEIITELKQYADDSVDQNLEILRNRIDEFGVSEPSVTKQGDRRVVVELAGITDVGRAKDIIGKTALLEFQLLKDTEVINEVFTKIDEALKKDLNAGKTQTADTLASQIESPEDTTLAGKVRKEDEVSVDELFGTSSIVPSSDSDSTLLVDQEVFEKNPFFSLLGALGNDFAVPVKNFRAVERIINSPEVAKIIPADAEFSWDSKPEEVADNQYFRLFLLKKKPELTGTHLTDAKAAISSGYGVTRQGEWEVNMQLDGEGAKIFSRVTAANIGKRLAVVLDGKVRTSPNIDERIPGGSAVIRGNMGAEEAKDLSIVLRAGSLQAPMHVIEERTVGPSLGHDSIKKGQYSTILGFALVIIFMVAYYKLSGLVANVALLLNILLVMAALALFNATLTLPGVAGIILTIGMAVDANVLIFERIREELKSGKTVNAAIATGYDRAFKTIFDANLTTLLTALVLYQFGTGPIRGFAVTLSIGIVASMFTSIIVTRVIFDAITSRRRMATLSI